MDDHAYTKDLQPTVENLSKAVYTVNRHAKTAPNPKYLYLLKKRALQKLAFWRITAYAPYNFRY